jgi:hypothetical protein
MPRGIALLICFAVFAAGLLGICLLHERSDHLNHGWTKAGASWIHRPTPTPPIPPPPPQPKPDGHESRDALAEVNATRAKRGLPAFLRDEALTIAAYGAAKYRAEHRIAGHTRNDFEFLPDGAKASAAGCAAWPPGEGWGACCTYGRYRFAGAAWVVGQDGRRYMHLFVRA